MSELQHHGIKGMHWGIRRYQNPDGSLTEEGRKRYLSDVKEGSGKVSEGYYRNQSRRNNRLSNFGVRKLEKILDKGTAESKERFEKAEKAYNKSKYKYDHSMLYRFGWLFGVGKGKEMNAIGAEYAKAGERYANDILATSNQYMSTLSKKQQDAVAEYVYEKLGWDW